MAGIGVRMFLFGGRNRRPRVFLPRENPLNLGRWQEEDLLLHFKLPREGIEYVANRLELLLVKETRRNCALSPVEVLCVALYYFGSGSYQRMNLDYEI